MLDIDFQDENVKQEIARVAKETGMSITELIEQIKYVNDHKRYVKFIKGIYKGTVGYVLPGLEIIPYAITVCTENGEIWCPNYDSELITISKEEYEQVIKGE